MRTRFIRLLRAFIVFAVIVALVGLYVLGLWGYRAMTTVASRCGGDPTQRANTPAQFDLQDASAYRMAQFEAVTFASRDAAQNLRLSAFYVPADQPNAPAVILVHGVSGCKRISSMLLTAGMLYNAGYTVLLLDMRNHGDSASDNGLQAAGTKEYRDVLGAYDYLVNSRGVRADQVALYGFSLGAATALIAAGQEPRIAGVWADSPFAEVSTELDFIFRGSSALKNLSPVALWVGRLATGDNLQNALLSPLAQVSRIAPRPVAFVHGTTDETIPYSETERLASAFTAAGDAPKVVWFSEGNGHGAAIFAHLEAYEQRMVAFFREVFAR